MKCPKCKCPMLKKFVNYGFMTTRIVENIWHCEQCDIQMPREENIEEDILVNHFDPTSNRTGRTKGKENNE